MSPAESEYAADWKRECVLITGSARRLGRALAEALAARRTRLLLHYHRSESQAFELANRCAALGAEATLFRADLADSAAVEKLIADVIRHQPTGLVNNASLFFRTPLENLPPQTWDEMLTVNLATPVRLASALGLAMKEAGRGSIVQIGDWSARRPYRNYLAYSVSKGALETATRSLARELAPEVRVNLVALGSMLLPENASAELEERIRQPVPLGRLGGTRAYVDAVLFMLGEAQYCTGTVLTVDGGRSLSYP